MSVFPRQCMVSGAIYTVSIVSPTEVSNWTRTLSIRKIIVISHVQFVSACSIFNAMSLEGSCAFMGRKLPSLNPCLRNCPNIAGRFWNIMIHLFKLVISNQKFPLWHVFKKSKPSDNQTWQYKIPIIPRQPYMKRYEKYVSGGIERAPSGLPNPVQVSWME